MVVVVVVEFAKRRRLKIRSERDSEIRAPSRETRQVVGEANTWHLAQIVTWNKRKQACTRSLLEEKKKADGAYLKLGEFIVQVGEARSSIVRILYEGPKEMIIFKLR